MKLILPYLAFMILLTSTVWSNEFVTTKEQKIVFLQNLNDTIGRAVKAREASQNQIRNAQSKTMELMMRHNEFAKKYRSGEMPPDGNQQSVDILLKMLCDPAIALPMGIKRYGYGQGWEYFIVWANKIIKILENDPVANPYLWYGRYDFYEAVRLYEDYYKTIHEKREEFLRRTCGQIKSDFIDALRDHAVKLDALNGRSNVTKEKISNALGIENEEARKAALDRLKSEMEKIKAEGDRVKTAMDRIGEALKKAVDNRSLDMRYEMNRLVAKLKALEFPERGMINGTFPEIIKFRNRKVFSITFKGKAIPDGLTPSDFVLPDGLALVDYQGGGKRLYVRIEKTEALKTGRHFIEIAGEKIYFLFEDSVEENKDFSIPLVEKGPSLPTSTGRVPEDGKGTFLTVDVLMDYPQDLEGFWIIDPEGEPSLPHHFEFFKDENAKNWLVLKGMHRNPSTYKGLKPYQKMKAVHIIEKGIIGQYDAFMGDCFGGLRATKEAPKPDGTEVCPSDRWWEPSLLCFEKKHLWAYEKTDGKKHDEETCELTDQPSELKIAYKRFTGISFTPFQPGKYIYTLTIGAPAGYKAAVGLEWDYSILAPAKITLKIAYPNSNTILKEIPAPPISNKSKGYIHVIEQPGRYWFVVEVFNSVGKMVHKDVAAAYLE